MNALTLHRPWAWGILHLDSRRAKRIENRTWAPPKALLGEQIAIHAGAKFDIRAAEYIAHVGGTWPPLDEAQHPLGIVGVARIVGYCEPTAPGARPRVHGPDQDAARRVLASSARWYMGSFGWLLDEAMALPEALLCPGARQLWIVPPDIEQRVEAALVHRKEKA